MYNKQGGVCSLESASFTGGRFVASSTGFTPHYFLTDHLGSTRVVVNSLGAVVEQSDYYPFGSRWDDGQISDNRYLFNGKEAQAFVNLPYLDYGARQYDPLTGRWFNVDPLSEIASSISPYAFCANNSANAIDLDGNLVVFINGFYLVDGASNYPRAGGQYSGNSWTGTRDYWRTGNDFDYAVMRHLNDYNAIYRDGTTGSRNSSGNDGLAASNRFSAGYEQGAFEAAAVINALARDQQGNIIETIKIITHSMGAAYAKGYVTALLQYLQKMGLDKNIIAFEADFAPFQPQDQEAVNGVRTFQFSHSRDMWAKNKKMPGAIQMDTRSDANQGHKLASFWRQVSQLPPGNYKVENGQIIPN